MPFFGDMPVCISTSCLTIKCLVTKRNWSLSVQAYGSQLHI